MAFTQTATVTRAYTRVALMQLQVRVALGKIGFDQATIQAINTGIENRWISDISVYGFNRSDKCEAEFYMNIDWSRNKLHVTAGKDSISVDKTWRNGVAIEVDETLSLFLDFMQSKGLASDVHIAYASWVDRENANRVLGFQPAPPVSWAGGPVNNSMKVHGLDEFSVGIRLWG